MTANVVHPADLERMLQARVDKASARRAARPSSRRRSMSGGRVRRGMTASISVSLLLVLSAVVALGVHGNGAFELDGNSVPDTSADDWDDISNGADVALVTTGIVPDEYGASKEDDQFTLGSKDTQDVSEWDWKAAVPPSDKTDLQNAYAALYDVGGELYLFLGADRDATNGNAKLGFWIFQDEIGKNADGTFSGEHKEGDLLIESAYTAGGTELGNINVWQWQGGDGTAGALSAAPIIVGADCRVNPAPVSDAVICSINNDEEITVDWAYQGKKLANDTPDPSHIFAGGFNETGIKLSHFFPAGIPCFSSILAETRAAGSSVDSATEDLVLGTFETCGNIDAHKYLDLDGNGQLDSGEPDLEGWTINLYESDGTTLIDSQGTDSDGNVSFEDLEAGDYVVCEEIESDTPAWVNSDPGDGTLCKDVTLDLGGSETVQFGNGQPDISITKTCTADVFVGDDIEYEITVTNTGNVDLVDVDVTDTLLTLTGADDLTLAAGASITFEPTLEATTTGTVNNTASVSGDFGGTTVYATVSDSANCATKVHELTVTKDATATWQRTYTWTIEKSVTPSSAEIFENDIQELDYTIDVTRSVSADAYALSGTITVSNPAPIAASLSSVTDSADGSTQTVMCPALTVPAADNGTPGELECTYSGSIPDASGTNTATATMTNGTQESGTANYSVASPTSEVAASASVDDVQSADTGLDFDCIAGTCSWPQNVSGSTQFTYTKEASSADAGVYDLDNTATVTFTGGSDSDSETATITVHALDVDKTANAGQTRTYTWTIEKSVTPSSAEIFENDVQELDYTIDVTRSVLSDVFALSGNITITNPNPDKAAIVNSLSDVADGQTMTVVCPDAFPITIPADDDYTCTYSGALLDGSGTNTATAANNNRRFDADGTVLADATLDETDYSGTADYTAGAPIEVAATASVDDVQSADLGLDFDCIAGTCSWPQNVSGSTQFTYTKEASSADAGVYDLDNTATVTFTGGSDSDSETVTITVHALDVDKTATPTMVRTYDWTVLKTVDPTSIEIAPGDSGTLNYSMTATRSVVSDVFALSGNITITNPNPDKAAIVNSLSDVADGQTMTVVCPDAFPITIPADDDYTCTYSGALLDGSGTNTATAANNNRRFDADGTVLADATLDETDYSGTADYLITEPTSEVDESATVDDPGITCPTGFTCEFDWGADGEPPWTFTASGSVSFSLTLTAGTGVPCDTTIVVENTATLVESDSGTEHDSTATASIYTGECPGEGCTPGFWQGGRGSQLWNSVNDPQWVAAGGDGTNPFIHTTLFNSFFEPHSQLDGKTMYALVSSGGGGSPVNRAARSLVAAYLNASFGLDYAYTTDQLMEMWAEADTNAEYSALHILLDTENNRGCTI